MTETRYFKVAGISFVVEGETEVFGLMGNYAPFASTPIQAVFSLKVEDGGPVDYAEELRQEDEGQTIVCGHTAEGSPVFEFQWGGQTAGWMVCSPDYQTATLRMTGNCRKLAVDNALMVLFALASARMGTVLFHAAVVDYEGRGYMFLGPSGTGKSTHARLWLKYIEGSELVNDDNPVVRINADGCATVYGSPWSGKTPCYRNVAYPLGGIVLLSQAPHNRIRRMGRIEAYAALVASISGKRWDKTVADGLHLTEERLIASVKVCHLECLPDEDAARICKSKLLEL